MINELCLFKGFSIRFHLRFHQLVLNILLLAGIYETFLIFIRNNLNLDYAEVDKVSIQTL